MRFGKRYRNPLQWGRPSPERIQENDGQPLDDEVILKPVAREERSALLGGSLASSDPAPSSPEPNAGGDVTQRLLTALGRFQRQVAKAREGAAQELWAEECMDQLEAAVEIALDQNWGEVITALTETARILQSYEDAGCAQKCVRFLTESYEVLCLMVGDLIGGEVRSGVMRRWEDCYARALSELRANGLEPVGDEAEESAPPGTDEREGTMASNNAVPDSTEDLRADALDRSLSPFAEPDTRRADDADLSDLPTLDDLPPLNVEGGLGEEPVDISSYAWDEREDEETPETPVRTWDVGAELEGESEEDGLLDEAEPELETQPLSAPVDELDDLDGADYEDEFGAEPEDEVEDDFAPTEEDLLDVDEDTTAAPEDEYEDIEDDAVFSGDDSQAGPSPSAAESIRIDSSTRLEQDLYLGGMPDVDVKEAEWAVEAAAEVSPKSEPTRSDVPDTSDEIVETLDRLCEGLAKLGEVSRAARPDVLSVIEHSLSLLQHEAAQQTNSGSIEACRTMTRMCRVAADYPGAIDDRFFELAYAFCGVYTEAAEDPADPAARNWRDECDALIESLVDQPSALAQEAEPVESVVPVQVELDMSGAPAAEAETPSVEAPIPEIPAVEPTLPEQDPTDLLNAAQKMMADGNPADAKLTALMAALTIGQSQVAEAHSRVTLAERRLREGAAAIDQARTSVRDAEQAVEAAEHHVAETRDALEASLARTQEIEAEGAASDARIQDIEEQIRALQTKRDEELAHKAAVIERLEGERVVTGQTQAELERIEQEEEAARLRLEDERQRVKDLQRRRTEVEAAMVRSREVLTRQMASFADIQMTVEQIRSAETGVESDSEDFLF